MSERVKLGLGIAIVIFGLGMIARGLWKKGRTPLGQSCWNSDECDHGQCMSFDGEMRCTTICAGDSSCPPSMHCTPLQVSVVGGAGIAMKRDYQATYCVPGAAR